MRKGKQIFIWCIWTIGASAVLTKLWLSVPQAFPEFPPSIAQWLASSFHATDAEAVADLEILIGFAISIPLVLLLTYLARKLLVEGKRHIDHDNQRVEPGK